MRWCGPAVRHLVQRQQQGCHARITAPTFTSGGPSRLPGAAGALPCFDGASNVRRKSTAVAEPKEEEEGGSGGLRRPTRKEQRDMARTYNERRAQYNRAVTRLRKQYADEEAERRRIEEERRAEEQRKIRRRKLEHRRRKNLKIAKSAIREEHRRQEAVAKFEAHLADQQQRREERQARFDKARQLVIDELELEAPYWLTTHEEVDAAFSKEGEQEIWGRRGGLVGAPPPSFFYQPTDEEDRGGHFDPSFSDGIPRSDIDFWRYECHAWSMEPNLLSPRELILQELLDYAYAERNIDSTYWTPERAAHLKLVEDKAKLRALVQQQGRVAILLRQREYMRHQFQVNDDDNPVEVVRKKKDRSIASPSVAVMARVGQMEREGSKLLLADPTKFFHFENSTHMEGGSEDQANEDQALSLTDYDGGTLGRPSGIRDPLRDSNPLGTPYPFVLGHDLLPDTRTAREKKQNERERKLLAAIEAENEAPENPDDDGGGDYGEDLLVDEEDEVNYETIDSEKSALDLAWEQEMAAADEDSTEDHSDTPRAFRLTEDDFNWIIEKLQTHAALVADEQQSAESIALSRNLQVTSALSEVTTAPSEDTTAPSEVTTAPAEVTTAPSEITTAPSEDPSFTALENLGIDTTAIKATFSSLTIEQRRALAALEEHDYPTTPSDEEGATNMKEEIRQTLRQNVPGLSDEQLEALTEFEVLISSNDEARLALSPDS